MVLRNYQVRSNGSGRNVTFSHGWMARWPVMSFGDLMQALNSRLWQTRREPKMSTKKAIALGCGAAALVAVIVVGIIIGWFIYVTQDVKGVSVSIDSPLDVKVGEPFDLTVHVENVRDKRVLTVSDIDISDDYLEGFVVISTEPVSRSSMHVPIDNSMSYTFDSSVPAGATRSFVFTLRAEQAGIFRGDVDVCEGQRFITVTAQTVVKD